MEAGSTEGSARTGSNPDSPHTRWLRLGHDDRVLALEDVELWWVELPFLAPVATAVGRHRSRPLILVRLRCRRASDGLAVDGWGECAALADTTYDTEDVFRAWAALQTVVLPEFLAAVDPNGGALPNVGALPTSTDGHDPLPLARAALEMAVGDAHLRAREQSFGSLLGVGGSVVQPGAVLGLFDSTTELLDAAERTHTEGYVRIKAKVAPGRELEVVETLTGWADSVAGPRPDVQIDANGAYRPDQSDLLDRLDPFGLTCIEQPFPRDDLAAHRILAAGMITPICLDESLDGPQRIVEAVTSGACSVVCIKPARLGGIGPALQAIEWCAERGVPWWIGGMFESGYGRRVTTAIAALPGPTLAGDLSLPSTYLAQDITDTAPDSSIDPTTGRMSVAVSGDPGMGRPPDPGRPGVHVVDRIGHIDEL